MNVGYFVLMSNCEVNSLKCTWQAFGKDMARYWQVYGKYMASIWQAHGLAIYLPYTCEMQLNYGSTTAQRYRSSSLRLALPPLSRVERRQFGELEKGI